MNTNAWKDSDSMPMMQNLIILGTSGNAYDILDIIEAVNAIRPTWNLLGFLDDARPAGTPHLRFPILGRLSEASGFGDCQFINAIGSDSSYRRRGEILAATRLPRERFATLVHPLAAVSRRAEIGRGVYVSFGVSVGGGVTIGDQVSLGPGGIIGHDSVVDALAILAAGAVVSGSVRVGRNCYIGAGATIRQGLTLGERALVGMGAVVVRHVESEAVVVGNPARPLRRLATSEASNTTAAEDAAVSAV